MRRTGLLDAPSMPVSSSGPTGAAAAAFVPHTVQQHAENDTAPVLGHVRLVQLTLPQRSHSMRRNHDGKTIGAHCNRLD
jgi:hypothetical protein